MRDSLKQLVEEMGGTVLMDGLLIQFGEESFDRAFQHIFEAGMDYQKQIDKASESSGDKDGQH